MSRKLVLCLAAALLASIPAAATVVYFADEDGNVGAYDDASGIVSPVGDLSAFEVDQVIGLAWDPATQRILLLDRNAPAVYAMDPGTGTATFLFDPGFTFQGGAVLGNALYGIDEETQTAEAFDLTSFADLGLSAAAFEGHHHGVGVDPGAGQLYIGGSISEGVQPGPSDGGTEGGKGSSHIATIGSDGSFGATVVTFGENVEDIDAYGADFLLASYTQELLLVNGTSGAVSVFLTVEQVTSAGVGDTVAGVAVATGGAAPPIVAIPTLGSWSLGLLALGLALAGALLARRRAGRSISAA